jgi:hypothetical protein
MGVVCLLICVLVKEKKRKKKREKTTAHTALLVHEVFGAPLSQPFPSIATASYLYHARCKNSNDFPSIAVMAPTVDTTV